MESQHKSAHLSLIESSILLTRTAKRRAPLLLHKDKQALCRDVPLRHWKDYEKIRNFIKPNVILTVMCFGGG